MVRRLEVGNGLQLPLQWMTMASVVYGTRGTGKSTLGRKLAEAIYLVGQRFCAIDPTGAWWGLKSTAGGDDIGLPVVIFGGDHADVPLEPGAGSQLADIVVEIDQPVILDLEYVSKSKQIKFLGDFLERLYHVNRDPLVLFMDEAQRYAPQKPMSPEANRTLGAAEDVVKLGRKHGIGPVLFTQRGSGLNKEVSELADVLIAFRTPGVLDQGRVKEWLLANATDEQMKEVLGKISGLPTGTAIFASNHPDLKLFGTYAIDRPNSFDSSSTPQVGQKRKEPRILSKPDLEALGIRMADAIERAEAEDPKKLKAKVAELERKLKAALERPQEPEVVERVVEKPVLTEIDHQEIKDAVAAFRNVASDVVRTVERHESQVALAFLKHPEVAKPPVKPPVAPVIAPVRAPPKDATVLSVTEIVKLTAAERRFLLVLGTYGSMSRERLAMLAGYKITSGHISNTLSLLRTKGLVEGAKEISATADGLALVDGEVEPLPKPGPELVAHWMAKLNKAERQFLEVIVDVYPESISGVEIAGRTGYTPTSGHISNTLSLLRTKGLVEGPTSGVRATESLMG